MAENMFEIPQKIQAKIDEYAGGHGEDLELSLDELESVSGGNDNTIFKKDGEHYIRINGQIITLREYHDVLMGVYNEYGVEVAIDFANSILPDPHNEERLRISGPDYLIGCLVSKLDTWDGSTRARYSIQ